MKLRTAASSTSPRSQILCYDLDTGKVIATLRGHRHPATHVSFGDHGSTMLTASTDCVIVWDATAWARRRVLPGGAGLVQCSFSPRGDHIVALFRNDRIVAWACSTFDVAAQLSLPAWVERPHLSAFALSPDETYLVAGGKSGHLFVWDVPSQVRRACLNAEMWSTSAPQCSRGARRGCSIASGGALWSCLRGRVS